MHIGRSIGRLERENRNRSLLSARLMKAFFALDVGNSTKADCRGCPGRERFGNAPSLLNSPPIK